MATRTDIITFPEFGSFNDTLQYILTVSYDNASGGTYGMSNDNLNLSIDKYGSQEADYRMDERLLIPNQIEIVFNDPDGELMERFFDYDNFDAEIKIMLNGSQEYIGDMINAPITADPDESKFIIAFSSNIHILNKTMVVDSSGNYVNPLDFTDIKITAPNGREVVKVKDAIKKIYQYINADVEFGFYHDWQFAGYYEQDDNSPHLSISDATFDELYVLPITMYLGSETLADCLKVWCERLFAKTGMINNNKAFFRKLFYYDSANLQSLNIIGRKKVYKYNTISYMAVRNSGGDIQYELPDANAFTTAEDEFDEIGYWWEPDNFFIIRDGIAYTLTGAIDPSLSGQKTFPVISANLLYNKRSVPKNNREDEFIVYGVNVDYAKNFIDGSSIYEINTMRKHNAEGFTNVSALYIGELI